MDARWTQQMPEKFLTKIVTGLLLIASSCVMKNPADNDSVEQDNISIAEAVVDWKGYKNAKIHYTIVNGEVKGSYFVHDSLGVLVEKGNYLDSIFANYVELYENGRLVEKKMYNNHPTYGHNLNFYIVYNEDGTINREESLYIYDESLRCYDTLNGKRMEYVFISSFPNSEYLSVVTELLENGTTLHRDSTTYYGEKITINRHLPKSTNLDLMITLNIAYRREDGAYRYRLSFISEKLKCW